MKYIIAIAGLFIITTQAQTEEHFLAPPLGSLPQCPVINWSFGPIGYEQNTQLSGHTVNVAFSYVLLGLSVANPKVIFEVQGRGDCPTPSNTNPSTHRDYHRWEFEPWEIDDNNFLIVHGSDIQIGEVNSKCFESRVGIREKGLLGLCESFTDWRFQSLSY